MQRFSNGLKNEEGGQGMVEYGLILVAVALAVIGALKFFGGNVKALIDNVNFS